MNGRTWERVTFGEWRRERRVRRLLRTFDRREAVTARRQARSRREWHGGLVLLVVLVGCAGAWQLGVLPRPAGASNGWPARPEDAANAPIGVPPALTVRSTAYAIEATQTRSADPVTYDPCVPIHVRINPRTAVPRADRIVAAAVEEIENATGLRLVIDGMTEDRPGKGRPVREPGEDAWSPVLLAWSDPVESPDLEGDVAGVGGSSSADRDGHRWFVTGQVVLDGPQLRDVQSRRNGDEQVRAVVMHELGHLVGLAHVDDSTELMFPTQTGRTSWGPGDRVGLQSLGRGRCVDY